MLTIIMSLLGKLSPRLTFFSHLNPLKQGVTTKAVLTQWAIGAAAPGLMLQSQVKPNNVNFRTKKKLTKMSSHRKHESGAQQKKLQAQKLESVSELLKKTPKLTNLWRESQTADWILCAPHSLNPVGVCSVDCCSEANLDLSLVQSIFNFFSASPGRWKILMNGQDPNKNKAIETVEGLSSTRWSTHAQATKALPLNCRNIYCTQK